MAGRALYLCVLMLASSAHADEQVSEVDQRAPDFAHTDWGSLAVAYVAASDSVKPEVDRAIAAAIVANGLLCLRENSCSWLKTAASYRHLQALLGNGRLSMNGYVCRDDPHLPHLRYYSTYFVDRGPCLPLFWDAKAHEFSLSDK